MCVCVSLLAIFNAAVTQKFPNPNTFYIYYSYYEMLTSEVLLTKYRLPYLPPCKHTECPEFHVCIIWNTLVLP